MEIKEIKINRTQDGRIPYLSEIIGEIPTNTIFCKTLTGLGATYTEIKSKRHSIIVEPNVSTIECKVSDPKHSGDNLYPIYGDKKVDSIIRYIIESKGKYMKFLTTPESFHKIKSAFDDLDMIGNLYDDCFILFDECHKIIQDADYRKTIHLPLTDFFRFKQKAMVSATPIKLSDERFNNFTLLTIDPQFDFRQELKVIFTNNTLVDFREVISNLKGNTVCVFLNSTDAIYSLMESTNILANSVVFCADESVAKLKTTYKFNQAYSKFDVDKMAQFNFFTSRFYAGMDIIMNNQPDLILFSDLFLVSHTMLDPHTDIPQIIGRFRNGISSVTHITNAVSGHVYVSKDDILREIEILEYSYKRDKREYETTDKISDKRAYKRLMDSSPFNQYLDYDGNKSYSAIDNYINDNLTKNLYLSADSLQQEYASDKMLIRRFQTTVINQHYRVGDSDRLTIRRKSSTISKRKAITAMWDKFYPIESEVESEFVVMCRKEDPLIVEALELTSSEKVKATKYYAPKLRELIRETKSVSPQVTELVRDSFHVGNKYVLSDIKTKMKEIFSKCGLPTQGITAQTLHKYFRCVKSSIKGKEALLIVGNLP